MWRKLLESFENRIDAFTWLGGTRGWSEVQERLEEIEREPEYTLIFDTETDGRSPQLIVQLAFVVLDEENREILHSSRLVSLPDGRTISYYATKIHGITNARLLEEGEDAQVVLSDFFAWVSKSSRIVAHNCAFDCRAVKATCRMHGLEFDCDEPETKGLCTMKNSAHHLGLVNKVGGIKPPKNVELYRYLYDKDPQGKLHDALVDCRVTAANYVGGRARGWW